MMRGQISERATSATMTDKPTDTARRRCTMREPSRTPLADIAVPRANETMMRAVAVFVGRAVRGATPVTTGRRPEAAEGVFRGMSPSGGESGSDGAQKRPCGQSHQGLC